MNLAAIMGGGPVAPPAGQPDEPGASKDPSFDAHLDESLSFSTVSEDDEEVTEGVGVAIPIGFQQEFGDWIAARLGAADPDPDGARQAEDAAGARPSDESGAVGLEAMATVPAATPAAIEPGAGSDDRARSETAESIGIEVDSAAPPRRGIPGFCEAPVEQGRNTPDGVPTETALAGDVRAERGEPEASGDPAGSPAPDPAGTERPSTGVVVRGTTQQTIVAADRTGEPSSAPQVPEAAETEERPKIAARATEQEAPVERQSAPEAPAAPQDPPAAAAVQDLEVVRQTVVRLEGRRYHAAAPPRLETHAQPAIDLPAASTTVQGHETPTAVDVASPTLPVISGQPGEFEASTGRRDEPTPATPARSAQAVPEAIAELVREISGGEQAAAAVVPPPPRVAPVSQEAAPRPSIHGPVLTQPAAVVAEAASAATFQTPRAPLPPETADPIIQSLRMQYQLGGGDAVVHIKPEHLGPVSVSVRVENGVVSAVVNADNPAVAEWLKANEHILRDGLASSGLHLERFAVRRDGQPSDDRGRHWRPPADQARRRRALQPESTFEISV